MLSQILQLLVFLAFFIQAYGTPQDSDSRSSDYSEGSLGGYYDDYLSGDSPTAENPLLDIHCDNLMPYWDNPWPPGWTRNDFSDLHDICAYNGNQLGNFHFQCDPVGQPPYIWANPHEPPDCVYLTETRLKFWCLAHCTCRLDESRKKLRPGDWIPVGDGWEVSLLGGLHIRNAYEGGGWPQTLVNGKAGVPQRGSNRACKISSRKCPYPRSEPIPIPRRRSSMSEAAWMMSTGDRAGLSNLGRR
ncbi:MAG: hypothetical protein M1824_000840 [Vezdaea acicularis]|nr:MAG: hypothetical protein M1824_000840 [Vezdaea acicularis]